MSGTPTGRDGRPPRARRRRRWLRRAGIVVVGILALAGAVSAYRFVFGPAETGHFRSAAGRAEYVAAYDRAMGLMPEPTAVHDVVTDWGVVRAYEWTAPGTEDSTPVVLVPGRTSGTPMWSGNLPGFAEDRRVLAFDALGDAGLSVQGVPLAAFEDQAHWMHQVLDSLAPDGAHVVGHSFGAATAAAYARRHPDDVVTLALLEPVFTFAHPPAGPLAWTVLASLPGLPDPLREAALGRVGGAPYEEADPVARMIAAGTEHYAASLPTPAVLTDEQASGLTMPVYVAVAATDSLAGGQDAADRARAVLPEGTVETWSDTTHSLPMQAAAPLAARLQDYWAAHESPLAHDVARKAIEFRGEPYRSR